MSARRLIVNRDDRTPFIKTDSEASIHWPVTY